jgi:hypothetical protein
MSHYAKVRDRIVVDVIVAEEEFFDTFIDTTPGTWIKTSYNTRGGKHYDPVTKEEDDGTPLRMNFGGIGTTYDRVADAFIPMKIFDSWTLDTETYTWKAPIDKPEDGLVYIWNEEGGVWEQVSEIE